MADKAWKVWEREGSKSLGGTRSGPTGRDLPDCIDVPLVAPEFKYYQRLLFKEEDFRQAVENAAKVGKIPVLAIKERGGKRKRVEMDWLDFVRLYHLAVKGATRVRVGDYVQLQGSAGDPTRPIPRHTRGTVISLEDEWAMVALPDGGRFEAHADKLAVLVRGETI